MTEDKTRLFLQDLVAVMAKHKASFRIDVSRDYSSAWCDLTFDLEGTSCGNELSLDVSTTKHIPSDGIASLI